ncbi:iron-sulfur cluster carrier protein ApbC [Actinomadura darangshiensis]|uniref:Iron-sulfur cluster carrier protein n=1 Tax=Actinomadura darangshiensis TaxID=705336 RepID=A0A4R5AJU2_9ACTN|nr:Mrp/NBP35 family ATP-binding protein [Actinomadura darangshiensis]TDD71850.1 iron-sulfur cluster carrier protein ApbC [Actinomadura darangshiensis]
MSDLEREVRAALASVEDPELHRPITDLGMVADVHAGRRGRVRVDIALTTSGCPMRERLRADVEAAARSVSGVRDVAVEFSTMSARQRAELGDRLRTESGKVRGALSIGSPAIYAVASGKGGVGKSTVTANLAVALARAGNKVGVLDADVWGPSMPLLFGTSRAPVVLGGAMMPVEAHGVRLMSTGFFVEGTQPLVWRGPMLHKAIQQFLDDVHWGDPDVLLVDLPPGTGDVSLSLLELVPDARVIVVTTPQTAARQVAERAGRMAADLGIAVAGVVENMSGFACDCGRHAPIFGSGGGDSLAEALGVPLLGRVPLDERLRESADAGVPVMASHPGTVSAVALRDVALSLPLSRPRRSLAGMSLPLSPV